MSHIRGNINKINELLKKGYPQPIIQQTKIYSGDTGVLGIGTHIFALTNIPAGKTGYCKVISVSCDDATTVHRVLLTKYDYTLKGLWNFFLAYFFINYEWYIPDVLIESNTPWYLIIGANAAATFYVNIYWIEV